MKQPTMFDSWGHEWHRDYTDDGEPILTMTCARCSYVWSPMETLQQIGKCSASDITEEPQQ